MRRSEWEKSYAEIGFAAIEASGGMWEACTRTKEELGWPPVILPESRTGIKDLRSGSLFPSRC